ncbi:MAG: DNA/RNA nuclease SfsA [Chloroflexi bacterium]|nr:DNA/RNA nuclease SfsA [Chloroflexota bacterium]
MRFPPLFPGVFVRRDNRFRATVWVDGRETAAHVANSGRLTDLFVQGRPVWLAKASSSRRKTAFDLKLVELPEGLVSVDARLPNPLFVEAVKAGRLPGFRYPIIQSEVRRGESRLDFRLSGAESVCWVETKSVTLVEGEIARFPDAPTSRGARHLAALLAARQVGERAVVVFVVQRMDAVAFTPHERADPYFAMALRRVAAAGVEVCAFRCRVSLHEIVIMDEIPVLL